MRVEPFIPDPIDLAPLRRTLRRVAARPEHLDECHRIINHAIADLEAVAKTAAAQARFQAMLAEVEAVIGYPLDQGSPSRVHLLSIDIDRWHRTRRGGYWYHPFRCRGHLSSVVELATSPLSEWTTKTVTEVIAAARAALIARGATGTCRVSLRFDHPYVPDTAVLCVRMGQLRACVAIHKGGCWCQRLPTELLEVLGQARPPGKSARWASSGFGRESA